MVLGGGRFGLGSASLSAASGFDLILFSSDLSAPTGRGKTNGRLLGRAVFPYHRVSDVDYEGPFFWGEADAAGNARRFSAWVTAEQRRKLWLPRDSSQQGATGTSLLIVGFEDPSGEDLNAARAQEALNQLANHFEEAFWPAIARGRLSASFTRYENDREVTGGRTLDSSSLTHPYATLFSGADDIVERAIPVHVPRTKDGSDAAIDQTARLLIKVLPDDDHADTGAVALMRGALMVVKYRQFSNLGLGARPFRAALLAGEAAAEHGQQPTTADQAAEIFLAKAEPPQHNDWTSRGTDLTSDYRGAGPQLEKLWAAIREALRDVVVERDNADDNGPEMLRKLLSMPGGGVPHGRRADVVKLEWLDPNYEALHAIVRINFKRDRNKVVLRPQLFVQSDAGAGLCSFRAKCDRGRMLCHIQITRSSRLPGRET